MKVPLDIGLFERHNICTETEFSLGHGRNRPGARKVESSPATVYPLGTTNAPTVWERRYDESLAIKIESPFGDKVPLGQMDADLFG